ncbi:MAG: thiol:disulfide interchange protein DsbA/DsbL [Gammaproteobacteria bacterium]|nr:thiol:disulfide interchange protein DsbA/DsbL [Gammaproteobacteria bacterium]
MTYVLKKLSLLLFFLLSFSPLSQAAAESDYAEGINYERITPPMPGGTNGKVEVIELFWYGCPHCDRFEPFVEKWLEKKANYIDFKQMPAVFNNPQWRLHATAFYTAEVLGVGHKLHKPIFDAIHRQNRRLSSKEQIREIFKDNGVSEKDFDKTFKSFAVKAKVARGADLTKKFGIDGVPAVIVNGKYRVNSTLAGGSYDNLLKIVDFLTELEHNK